MQYESIIKLAPPRARALALTVGAALLVGGCALRDDRSLTEPAPPAFGQQYECPEAFPNCRELTPAEMEALEDAMALIINSSCGWILDTLNAYLSSGRLYATDLGGYSGWFDPDDGGSITIDVATLLDPEDTFYTIIHEPRHAAGHAHDSTGYFHDEIDYADNCAVGLQEFALNGSRSIRHHALPALSQLFAPISKKDSDCITPTTFSGRFLS